MPLFVTGSGEERSSCSYRFPRLLCLVFFKVSISGLFVGVARLIIGIMFLEKYILAYLLHFCIHFWNYVHFHDEALRLFSREIQLIVDNFKKGNVQILRAWPPPPPWWSILYGRIPQFVWSVRAQSMAWPHPPPPPTAEINFFVWKISRIWMERNQWFATPPPPYPRQIRHFLITSDLDGPEGITAADKNYVIK